MSNLKETTIELYNLSEHIIFWSRHQNYSRMLKYLKLWFSTFSYFTKLLFQTNGFTNIDSKTIVDHLNLIMDAQKNDDYILLSDLLENNILGLLSTILSNFDFTPSTYSCDGKTYNLVSSLFGLKTIQIDSSDKSFYLHSISNPVREALTLTDNYFNPEAEGYIIFGCGIGYFPVELYLRSDKAVPVMIYECDKTIYDISKKEHYYESFESNYFTVTYDPNLDCFIDAIENNPNFSVIIHSPSINNVTNSDIKSRLNELFIHDSSIRDQKCTMVSNFRSNTSICTHYVDELSEVFKDKDVYLIAAGPSLDNNVELLKTKPENAIILAVGAVYKKLISMNICPDYVVFLDANEIVYNQFDGLQNDATPLLIASTAYCNIAINSKANTYLVCQNGFNYAEKYAFENNYSTYETGGSVSTIAFDIAIKLGAKRVITLGLDLSYTKDGKLHADSAGIQQIPIVEISSNTTHIEGYYGESVLTTPSFELYRQWFIRYIANLKKTKNHLPQLINATEGGCFIPGMEHISLKSVLKNS